MEELQQDTATASEEPIDPLDNDEINNTAKVFMDALPRAKALASNMKAGSLGRVFNAVLEYPLGDKYPKFRSRAENELFIMTLSLLVAKNKMMQAVAEAHAQTQELTNKAISEAANAVAQTETKQEESVNG